MLFWVRLVHTLIYFINGAACFVVLGAGLTGTVGTLLWIAVVLVGLEALILVINGWRCPMTPLAIRYGARETDFLFDTFLPERLTRHTVPFFSTVVLAGLALIGLRLVGIVA